MKKMLLFGLGLVLGLCMVALAMERSLHHQTATACQGQDTRQVSGDQTCNQSRVIELVPVTRILFWDY